MENHNPRDPFQNLEAITNFIASEMGVALYFSAPKCGVCVSLKPKIEQLLSQVFPKIKFTEIASQHSPLIAGHFGVFAAPTLVIFFEGKEFHRYVRNWSLLEMEQKLKRPYQMLEN